ncbi:uncharacterized protein LOC110831423 isoform X2 [Zootermopsis nevadensis]|uniref:uncharacterized protein LOC110831423 isoform X2 n=1 Tax=Zootermopsis nevadensis TaxID=136037 RepID=UPI000B8EB889|nr:uncharacterized protein LOC110831423 isoform X2 [Zootermopsis nevadensis]
MFISDVVGSSKEELHNVIVYDLRHIGVKHRIKKSACKNSQHLKHGSTDTKVFKVPLHHLVHEVVFLNFGTAIEVPCFVARACSYIKQHIQTEGIFRKAGSTSRQRELKASVECGKMFGPEHHVIDVANILKKFFRELPEPLIPHAYHEVLLRCLLLKDNKTEGILLTCLLIPTVHINTLAYLMQFLQEVASHSDTNKMDVTNLALIIAPSVMPVEEKIVVYGTSRLSHHVEVVELLISNADKIGNLPESIRERLAANNSVPSLSNDEQDGDSSRQNKKKKKRRSGSITRMLNGLKKMVGKGTPEVDEGHLITSTPDFSTPYVKSSKKRKAAEVTSAFSSKKSPSRKVKSPQSVKQRHRRFFTPKLHTESVIKKINGKDTYDSCKKTRLSVGSWSGKKQKPEELAVVCNPFGSDITCHSDHASRGSSLERSWTAGPWARKKLLNLSDIPMFSPSIGSGVDITSDGELAQVENRCVPVIQDAQVNLCDNPIHVLQPDRHETEFVRIPKSEYEAIKNIVSVIENRILQEFGNMSSASDTDSSACPLNVPSSTEASNNTELVQTAYERTLVESEKLGDASADHLARRLSRELRIHRSLENKVIRSPSARKIGTIRRRSKKNAKPVFRKSSENNGLGRNMSWHLAVIPSCTEINQLCPRTNLKRGRPNTVFTGLPQPSPRNAVSTEHKRIACKSQHDQPSEGGIEEILQKYQSCLLDDEMMNMMDLTQYLDVCRKVVGPMTRSKARRASSFHGSEWAFRNQSFRSEHFTDVMKSNSDGNIAQTTIHSSLGPKVNADIVDRRKQQEDGEWKTADVFFSGDQNIKEEVPVTGRASVAKLRIENAGMVLERMKLFDAKANCSLGYHEKEKSMTDSKTKRLVNIPSVFGCNANATRSVGIQYSGNIPTKKHSVSRSSHSKSVQRIHSSLVAKSGVSDLEDSFKDSPKKMGTPRRRHGMKSPNGSHQKQKLKVRKSPSKADPISIGSPAATIRRKHNSMKLTRDRVCTNVKANLTVPIKWLSTEKENVLFPCDNTYIQPNMGSQSGKDVKEDSQLTFAQANMPNTLKEVCSPAVCKTSFSPLKDCNRIEVNSQIPHCTIKDPSVVTCSGCRTPRETPYIKKALLTKSPSQFCRTPKGSLLSTDRSGCHHQTPMKAVADFGCGTTVASPRRHSPRLLGIKSRNLS